MLFRSLHTTAEVSRGEKKLRVCVIDYNPLAACVLRRTLENDGAIELISDDVIVGRRTAASVRVPVFVLDKGTLPTPISKCLRYLRCKFPEPRTVIVDYKRSDEELVQLIFLGIHSCVSYSQVENTLKSAIQAVSKGHVWIPQNVLEQYVARSTRLSRFHLNGSSSLTRRERGIIEFVQRRHSNKEISSMLGISESTVKFHLSNIFDKLGVRDRHSVAEVARSGQVTHMQMNIGAHVGKSQLSSGRCDIGEG